MQIQSWEVGVLSRAETVLQGTTHNTVRAEIGCGEKVSRRLWSKKLEEGTGLTARHRDTERPEGSRVFELERVVSCRSADPWWRTKLDFGSGKPFDDLHRSTALRAAPKIGSVFGGGGVLFGLRLLFRAQQLKAKRWIELEVVFKGRLISIHISPNAGAPMQSVDVVEAIAGRGLRGDRYFEGMGHWSSHAGVSRDVTLVEIESIAALGREKSPLSPEALAELAGSGLRRNLVTRGVPLNHLVDVEFQVGDVRLRGTRLCEPCHYLESVTGKTLFQALVHHAGLRCDLVTSGVIRVGDAVLLRA